MNDGRDPQELVAALRTGELSVVEVVRERLDLLHRSDEQTHAVAWFEDDLVLRDARRLDEIHRTAGPVGPLHGLPVTVKDWIDVAGFPCTAGQPDSSRRPDRDATVVARLRAAGAVVVAKSVVWGPNGDAERVRHPVDPARTPGGSSTGESVLVATGASVLGIGSDSGGSIRLPAAWCGVLGHKPTSGLVPTTGHYPRVGAMSDGRTQIGPLCADAALARLALDVIAGPDGHDGGVAPVRLDDVSVDLGAPLRFAVLTEEGPWTCASAIRDGVERAAALLESAGHERVPWHAEWLVPARDITERYWTRSALSGAEVEQQLVDWDRYRSRYLRAAADIPLLLTPTTREVAPTARDIVGDDFVFTLPASLTGSPALTVPVDSGGSLPAAVQLVGRPWQDRMILGMGQVLAAELS